MKKVYSIFAIALGCLALASCSDDDYTEKVSSIQITAADTQIESVGGTRTIVVSGDIASAVAADEWLSVSVSGNTITVSADANNSRESRHTTVTVTAPDGDAQIVNILQLGMVFVLGETDIKLGDDAGNVAVDVTHNMPVTVTSLTDWITATFNAGTDSLEIQVKENATAQIRTGYVEVRSGGYVDTLAIEQFEFEKDILGEYTLYAQNYSAENSPWYAYPATLTKDSIKFEYADGLYFSFPISIDEDTWEITYSNGSLLGTYGPYYVYQILSNYPQSNYWAAYSTTLSTTGVVEHETDDEGNLYTTAYLYGDYYNSTRVTYSWYLRALSAQEFVAANSVGNLDIMTFPQMEKVVYEDGNAKRSVRRNAAPKAKKTLPSF